MNAVQRYSILVDAQLVRAARELSKFITHRSSGIDHFRFSLLTKTACVVAHLNLSLNGRFLKMGGENCAVVGCSLHRKIANKFISFHDINSIKDVAWRDKLIHSLGRNFQKEGGVPRNLYICSRHFEAGCIITGKYYFHETLTYYMVTYIYYRLQASSLQILYIWILGIWGGGLAGGFSVRVLGSSDF